MSVSLSADAESIPDRDIRADAVRLLPYALVGDHEGLRGELAQIAAEIVADTIVHAITSHPDGIDAGMRQLGAR